jgi:hypothetical protein
VIIPHGLSDLKRNDDDVEGAWQHTISLAATPECGKATFLDRMEREIPG